MNKILTLFLVVFLVRYANAQTGPGGVGDASTNILWLIADSISGLSPGDAVTSWNDLSGNGNHATANNSPIYNYGAYGQKAVFFDGDDYFTLPASLTSGLTQGEIFIVPRLNADPPSSGTYTGLWRLGTNGNGWNSHFPWTDGRVYEDFGSTTRYNCNNPGPLLTQYSLYNVQSRTNFWEARINGSSIGNSGTNTVLFYSPATIGKGVSTYLQGSIAEVIMFNQTLNQAQRIIIDNYLSATYGMSIQNDRFAFDPEYSYEVAGLGRVNASNTHNDAQGKGILRINNASGLSDGDFLMWGHNGLPLSLTDTADVDGTTISGRWSRLWIVDETDGGGANGVGTVDIAFDLSTLSGLVASELRLLIDRDGDGFSDNDVTPVAGTFAGSILTFAGVDFQDGDRFTLGTINHTGTPLGTVLSLSGNTGPGGVGDSLSISLWLSADSLTSLSPGDAVTTWNDISGNNNSLTAHGDPLFTLGANGHMKVYFDGTTDYFDVPSSAVADLNQAEIFIVPQLNADPPANTAYTGFWDFGQDRLNYNTHLPYTDGRIFDDFGSDLRSSNFNPGSDMTSPFVYGVYTQKSEWQNFVNGEAGSTITTHAVIFDPTPTLGKSITTPMLQGGIYEMVLYNKKLNDAQRVIVNNYLSTRYGTSIISDKYSYDGTHGNELAGIGQTNATNKHTDAQGSSLLRIKTPDQLNNNEFMLWGHNGADLNTADTADVDGTTVEARWKRIWRIDETGGDVGNVTVMFDLRRMGNPNSSDLVLLIDRDGDGFYDNDVAPGTSSESGNWVVFNTINFQAGDLFTLGSTNKSQTPLGSTSALQAFMGPGGVGDSSTLAFWYVADSIQGLNDNDPVNIWNDISGNENHATAVVLPTFGYATAGARAVAFNGSSQYFQLPSTVALNTAEAEIFALTDLKNEPPASGRDGLWDFGTSVNVTFYPFSGNSNIYDDFGSKNRYNTGNPTPSLANACIYNVSAASGYWRNAVNGIQQSLQSVNTFGLPLNPTLGKSKGAYYFDGLIPELFMFRQRLNTAQRTIVENYLAARYRVVIANDLYAYESSHGFEVAGIGRDDANNQHTEAKGSGMVHVRQPSSLGNGDYMLWGHNNRALNLADAVDVDQSTIEARMQRTWRADVTDGGGGDGTGTVSVIFHLDLLGTVFVEDLRLIIDRDGDGFADNDVSPQPGVACGNNILFTNVSLQDGDCFTLGTIDKTRTALGTPLLSQNHTGPGGVGDQFTNIVWLRADSTGYAIGNTVSAWKDVSGNSNNATANETPTLINGSNGQNAVYFDGDNDYFSFSPALTAGLLEAEVFVVPEIANEPPASSTQDGLWLFGSSGQIVYYPNSGNSRVYDDFGSNTRYDTNDPPFPLSRLAIYNVASSTNYWQNRINGNIRTTSASNTTGFSTTPLLGKSIGTHYLKGGISEFFIYNQVLNTAQRLIVENYLAAKYGVNLPTSSDLFAWENEYNGEVAGIGRVDAANQHTDAQGTSILRINKPTALENNDFLMWGHNNKDISMANAADVDGTLIQSRMVRLWRLDETDGGNGNGVGNVDITFDLRGFSPLTPSDVRLLIDRDGDGFADNDVAPLAGTASGDTITFASVDIQDGDIITLGSINKAQTPLGTLVYAQNHLGPGGVGDQFSVNFWLLPDSIQGVSIGQTVSTWKDISGNANDATAIGTPTLENGSNGHKALQFNGTTDYFSLPSQVTSSLNEGEIFIVPEIVRDPSSSSTRDGLWTFGNSGTPVLYTYQANARLYDDFGSDNRYDCNNPPEDLSRIAIYNVTSRNSFWQNRINGNIRYTNNSSNIGFTDAPLIGKSVGNHYLDGKISEMFLYNHTLNAAQRLIVENYLAAKYGITIPAANDKYVYQDAYNQEVGGIGRVDAANQHSDAQGTAIVRIKSPSALSDGDFMLWGHNGHSLTTANAADVDGTLIQSRLVRLWRLDETDGGAGDGVGTVDLSFDVSSFSPLTPSDVRLLIDRDGDGFADNDVAPVSGNYSNGYITFSGIDLTDGDIFTLGSINKTQTPLGILVYAQNHLGPGGVGDQFTLNFWLLADSTEGVDVGQLVASWPDLSGNNNDATSSGSPNLVYGPNGKKAVRLNGTTDYFTLPSVVTSSLNEGEIFIVPEIVRDPSLNPNSDGLWTFGNSGNPTLYTNQANARLYEDFGSDNRYDCNNPAEDLSKVSLYNVIARNNYWENRINGNTRYTNTGNTIGFTDAPLIGKSVGNHYLDGTISEVILYNTTLNDAQRIIVENYLSARYGVAIPNDRYAYDNNYGYQLAGIGRTSASSLHTDAQGNSMLRIKYPSALDNGDFLLWGHNNKLLEISDFSDVDGSEIQCRMIRTWRATETDGGSGDGVGTVSLIFDMSAFSPLTGSDLRLLVDRDGDGFADNDVVPVAGTYSDGKVTFSNIDINSGDYFTVGSINKVQTPLGTPMILHNHLGPGGVGDMLVNNIWLIGDSITSVSTGQTVTEWRDVSGNDNHATGSGSPTLVNGANGKKAVSFNGADACFNLVPDVTTTLNQGEIFLVGDLVADPNPTATMDGLWLMGRSALPTEFPSSSNSRVYDDFGSDSRYDCNNPAENLANVFLYNVRSMNGFWENKINGNVRYTRASNTVLFSATPQVGKSYGSNFFNGNISEMFLYNRALNTAERIIVENYVSSKYGIPIANDRYAHDLWYGHEVAGIGRIDAANFHADAQGTSIVRILNPSALDDNDYMLWGHNNANMLISNISDVDGLSIECRMNRVWRADITDGGSGDGVGTVTMEFDLEQYHPLNLADIRLLIDRDEDGFADNDVLPLSGVANGNIIIFTGITLNDNDLFTLGSTDKDNSSLGIPSSLNQNKGPGGVGDSSTITIWLRADSIIGLDFNDPVAAWNDVSGLNHHATANNSPKYVSGANGRPAVYFDNTLPWFDLPADVTSTLNQGDVFIVTQIASDPPANTTLEGLWRFGSSGGSTAYPRQSNATVYDDFGSTTLSTVANPATSLTQAHIYNVVAQNSFWEAKLNGNTIRSLASNSVAFNTTPWLGRSEGAKYLRGNISEFFLFNTSLNSAQRLIVQNYLAAKYSIAIANDLYAYQASYGNEVAGIGRISQSSYHKDAQGQSILRIRKPSALDDGDFMLWGNNALVPEFTSADCDATLVGNRLETVWQIDITDGGAGDGPGTVTASIDIRPEWPEYTTFYLLIDRDGDGFADNDVAPVAGTIDSSQVVFEGIAFQDGDLLSIGIPAYIWNGTVDTQWHNPLNWNHKAVPTEKNQAVIPGASASYPEITGTAECNGLTITNPATLTIQPSAALTVHGPTQNNGTITLRCPTNSGASGSLIDNGITGGTGTVNVDRFISRNEWHYVSSPVETANSKLFTSNPPFNPNFFAYNESLEWPDGWEYAHDGKGGLGIPLEPMKGYAYFTNTYPTIAYTGKPHTGTLSTGLGGVPALSYTDFYNDGDDANDGWNLIGNPYPSALDWDSVTAHGGLTNVDNSIYFWDGNNYKYYVAGGIDYQGTGNTAANGVIPVAQGFFVKAYAPGPKVTLTNADRIHSSLIFYKDQHTTDNVVRLNLSTGNTTDETIIRFIDQSTGEHDSRFDAYKLFTTVEGIPQLYSLSDQSQTPLAINTLPAPETDKVLNLGTTLSESGDYTLSLSEYSMPYLHDLILEDTETGKLSSLIQAPEVNLRLHSGVNTERLRLHFIVETPSEKPDERVNVYSSGKMIYVVLQIEVPEGELEVCDISGKKVLSKHLSSTFTGIPFERPGVFVARLRYANQLVIRKVYIAP